MFGLVGSPTRTVKAANPPVQQFYYVSLPEDDLLQLFDDDDDNADVSFPNPVSPIRSITSISISSTGTWVYYDQWEDGSYDALISEPGGNVYANPGNLDGTQIWGDGVLANGCPPSINDVPNPCLQGSDDLLDYGDVIILDNDVAVSGTTPGPYSRSTAQIFYDGRDKFGVSFPVAVTRGAYPVSPGSVMAGGNEVLDTSRWGMSYEAPLGENTSDSNTNAFEDVRWFIMAGAGGATIDVDANGDGDLLDANDLNDFVMIEGAKRQVDGILMGATLKVVSGNPVQINSMTADVNDTFEFRWDALLPRDAWSDDYYTPVGTLPKANNSGCTEVEIYNPNSPVNLGNYRDEFGTIAYSNNNGSLTWSNNWQEVNETDGANAGDVQIINGELRIGEDDNAGIYRTANLSGATTATLTFDFRETGGGAGVNDVLTIQQTTTAPTGWQELGTINDDNTNGTRTYPLTISANTSIRFIITNTWEANKFVYIDNVNISLLIGSGAIVVNYDFPGGSSPDGNITIPSKTTATGQTTGYISPSIPYNNGAHFWSQGGEEFLPISVTDCTKDTSGTDGRLYDWGNPLFPADQLTDQVLVGWAPGCSSESFLGVCRDSDSQSPYDTRDITTEVSRSVVWITPLANTIIYVDTDGSGITCPGGAGAEQTRPVDALVSSRFTEDPTSRAYVRHSFSSGNYTGTDNIGQGWTQTSSAWANNWTETGDEGASNAGAIQVITQELRFGNTGTSNETGWTIRRGVNLSGQTYANLRFHLRDNGLTATDKLAVEVTADGLTWFRLATYQGDQIAATYNPIIATDSFNISRYISSNTAIRFVILNNITSASYWFVDDVHIDYAIGGDWDMTGARIATCDGTPFAAAWGQDPALSGGNDEEALDLGTGITPLGSRLVLDKYADKNQVAVGGMVNYYFAVKNLSLLLSLENVTVTDNRCSPAVYSSGDTNNDEILAPNGTETWIFTCSTKVFVDTTNVAFASDDNGIRTIYSAPDQWRVTVIPSAALGNYVWLDEDGDGDQDAGEAGIPNMKVELCSADGCPPGSVLQTTYTDTNGGYLFDGLNAGTYYVRTTPASGLNPTYDENGTGTPNITSVTVVAGDEHLTADFGYNWSTTDETNLNSGTGAIGDRVWIDADGDGVQDGNEAGLGGVTVELWYDSNLDGVIDAIYPTNGTKTTDAAGNYIFDDLPAGIYEVRVPTIPFGYSQTGDPDANLDNKTSSPIVLGPGDVYVNADFGYQPIGSSSDIGDTVWFDHNVNGVQDAGELGIPGVTVALIVDDGDGVYEPGIDKIIATAITDEAGQYLFPGLPAGTYFVEVTDTENVLGELAPTYDADNGLNERSMVTINGVNDNLDQDFGYARPGQSVGEGLIGDTIWLDRDNDNSYDPGEGLEGVRVILTDPGFDGILGTSDDYQRATFTDENGHYSFGKLEPSLSYRVTVDITTLPAGVTNVVDPDVGTPDSTTVRNLSVTGPIDLGADFAYRATISNTISGTIWEDTNADGLLTETGRFAGVSVVLRDSDGNIVATTWTDSDGNYSFAGLPDGTYTVDVTDDDNVLNGFWHSDGPNDGANNNSQLDPYTVTVIGGQTNSTADFGYYVDPAGLGNFVWVDTNHNGIQDDGAVGVIDMVIELTITWPSGGGQTVIRTVTDEAGIYSFLNLLLDEDHDGVGDNTVEPTFVIRVLTPYATPTTQDAGINDAIDSDNPANQPATTTEGFFNPTFDFGYYLPTSISLLRFESKSIPGGIMLTWETASEKDNLGFYLWRATSPDGERIPLNNGELISPPVPGATNGALYTFFDQEVTIGVTYWYWLQDLSTSGGEMMTSGLPPVSSTPYHFMFVPIINR